MELPAPLRKLLDPLFAALPLAQAMSQLVVKAPAAPAQVALVEELVQGELPAPLKAALWLYVDELDKSHRLAQQIEDQTGSYWHGIMHRREGDFSNSHYWFNKVGQHPAMALIVGYDPHAFIDAVSRDGGDRVGLVELQRREWTTLFSWCAAQ
ncbi:MAG: hypothetical protein HYW07_03885 [Candidatus Latescibacteria bacterium]|nr:hypothetical protein [Candidatus Latescibacterota bacterium]